MRSTTAPDLLTRKSVKRRWIAAAACAAILFASFAYAPFSTSGPVLCSLRFVTGIPCPGCGLTRSFCALSHGHVAAGFAYHWLGPLFFLVTIIAIPVLVAEAIRRRPIEPVRRILFSYRVGWTVAALLVAQWLTRVVYGA